MELLALLQTCPVWTYIDQDDAEAVAALLNVLCRIAAYDDDSIRRVEANYIWDSAWQGNVEESYRAGDRLYLINKFVFAVPDKTVSRAEIPYPGGWRLLDETETGRSLMWPLGLNEAGQIILNKGDWSYTGPPFIAAVDQFDFYREKYGRRPFAPK